MNTDPTQGGVTTVGHRVPQSSAGLSVAEDTHHPTGDEDATAEDAEETPRTPRIRADEHGSGAGEAVTTVRHRVPKRSADLSVAEDPHHPTGDKDATDKHGEAVKAVADLLVRGAA